MTNQELIKQIREDLEEISPDKNNHQVQALIHSTTRSVNRLQVEDKKLNVLVRRFAVDLMQIYTSEVKYWNLNKVTGPGGLTEALRLSESFFRSVYILKDELLAALKKISNV